MTVLVDVAESLQRTRTGLRVLLDLLVARREHLTVGQIVPVGDLYDVIDSSDDPFSDAMRSAFDQARKIYKTSDPRCSPSIGADDEPTPAFVNDDRLIKTLLLAALVPESVPFNAPHRRTARGPQPRHHLLAGARPGDLDRRQQAQAPRCALRRSCASGLTSTTPP